MRQRQQLATIMAALVAILSLSGVPEASAEVHFATRVSTFPVSGTNPVAVLNSIRRNGPVVKGRRAFASTRMRARWEARFRQRGGRCRVERLRVRAQFEITLPKATGYRRFAPAVQREWRQFVRILERHEHTHAQISRRCIVRAERRLRRMTAPTCDQLKNRLRSSFRQSLAACRSAHDRLDHRDVRRTPKIPFVRRAIMMRRALMRKRLNRG